VLSNHRVTNRRQPILSIAGYGIVSLLLVGHLFVFAHASTSSSTSLPRSPIIVAKKAKQASPLIVKNVRHHDHKTYTRVVLDLPARVAIKEKHHTNTNQATIELPQSRLSKRALKKIKSHRFPRAITINEVTGQTVRVTLNLNALKKYELQTLRRPNRVVVDLFYSKKKKVVASKGAPSTPPKRSKPSKAVDTVKKNTVSESPSTKKRSTPRKPNPVQSSKPPAKAISPPPPEPGAGQSESTSSASLAAVVKRTKDLVVIIDPGHGGKDPGAVGKKGTQEKHITLKIGRYLKDMIHQRLGAKVFLTRTNDVFLDLEERVKFANKKKANLFISIHVNSHPQRRIKGLEVYHFGKASDPRALQVAARENGIRLENDAPPWQFILADALNGKKIEESQTFAWNTNETLVKTLKGSYNIKDHGVKTAPFYVLRFTTMPSILAEVAFISNPEEEKRLRSPAYQKRLAEGMYKGIQSYLKTAFPTLS